MTQFRRKARVHVGRRVWSDVRISMTVEASDTGQPNHIKAEIYNLSDDSTGYLQDTRGLYCELLAGYDIPALIGAGDVQSVETTWRGPDRITRIECADGGAQNEQRVTVSRSGKSSTKELLESVADDMGFSGLTWQGVSAVDLADGIAFSGAGRELIDSLTRASGAKWHVQSGRLVVLPKGAALDKSALLLTPDTGLVGSPQRTDEGIKIECLLNPAVLIRRVVRVESREVKGFYTVRAYRHEADTHSHTWLTTIEAVRRG